MVADEFCLGGTRRPYDDILNIWVGKGQVLEHTLHDPLKDGIAILEAHHKDPPPHGSPRGGHAGEFPVFLL